MTFCLALPSTHPPNTQFYSKCTLIFSTSLCSDLSSLMCHSSLQQAECNTAHSPASDTSEGKAPITHPRDGPQQVSRSGLRKQCSPEEQAPRSRWPQSGSETRLPRGRATPRHALVGRFRNCSVYLLPRLKTGDKMDPISHSVVRIKQVTDLLNVENGAWHEVCLPSTLSTVDPFPMRL